MGNWFPWLKNKLSSFGHSVEVPRFPTPDGQFVENWHRTFDALAPRPGPDTVLIGHSCGATFILHVLEALPGPVAKSVFVSGFLDELGNEFFDNLNKSFINHAFDWDKIRRNAGEITLFHGDNDPYVPLAAAESLSTKLKTPLTIIPNGGHLNAESGYVEFPQILDVL